MNTDFWLAVSTIGPVMFLAIGVFEIDLIRGGGLPPAASSKRTAVKVELVAINVAFLGTLLPTSTAILSLAWRQDLLPPKLNAVVIVVAISAYGIALTAHWYDLKRSIIERQLTAGERHRGPTLQVKGQPGREDAAVLPRARIERKPETLTGTSESSHCTARAGRQLLKVAVGGLSPDSLVTVRARSRRVGRPAAGPGVR